MGLGGLNVCPGEFEHSESPRAVKEIVYMTDTKRPGLEKRYTKPNRTDKRCLIRVPAQERLHARSHLKNSNIGNNVSNMYIGSREF